MSDDLGLTVDLKILRALLEVASSPDVVGTPAADAMRNKLDEQSIQPALTWLLNEPLRQKLKDCGEFVILRISLHREKS